MRVLPDTIPPLSVLARAAPPTHRLLILAPTGRDAPLMHDLLRDNGISSSICNDFHSLARESFDGVAGVVLAEEAMREESPQPFADWIARQPAWSDLPVLLLTHQGADSATVTQALEAFGNVTLLERPTRAATLTSAARAALRARDRQYQVRDQLLALERSAEALRASEGRLLEADRRKDEFLATLAHELRNPLAPIRNALHLLRLPEVRAADDVSLHEMMERQVNHMVRLVDDLLEISRITRGKIDLQLEPVSVAALVGNAIETSRPALEKSRQHLEVHLPDEPLFVEGDSVRLAQVIANLLNNAAKYTDEGGSVDLDVRQEQGTISITVRDSGIGIPPEMLPRVFDMFTQVRDTSSRSQGGLGIGLTLVRSLVQMHGGSVVAESPGSGQGSRFTIRLPALLEPAASHEALQGAIAGPVARSQKILVVDDNADAADSLGMVLGMLGAEVQVVHGGQEALDALIHYQPDVLFIDIGMPDIDGYEVARRIRANSPAARATLIALTGWGQQEDRRRSAEAGFDRHLVKPVGLDALKALLESLA